MKKISKLNVKISIGIILFIVIVSIVEVVFTSFLALNGIYEDNSQLALQCGRQALASVDSENVDKWLKNGPDENYSKIYR